MRLCYLLVMPRLVQNIGDGYVFPLGMAYISSTLKENNFHVHTLNLNHHEGKPEDIIREYIIKYKVNIVGAGGLSPQYHLVKFVLESVKAVNDSIITIVGGGLISADPETAMRALEFADYGVIGEGEETIIEFSSALEQHKDIKKVSGLIIKNKGKYDLTSPRQDIKDIDSIPWPDYEGFDLDQYLKLPPPSFGGLSGKRMIPMLGIRSCPYGCTFCFHSIGKKYRRRSLDDFFAELDHLLSRYDIQYISMADELFAPKIEHAKEFCARMKQYNLPWHADFSINQIKKDLLPILKEGGCDTMFFGLESADNGVLKSMRKGLTIEKTEHVLKMVQEAGITIYGCFIFGDISETVVTAKKTMKWWREHPEYLVHLTLIKPFPGSYIYTHACQDGRIKDKVKYLQDGCPQINISKMTDAEFSRLASEISCSSGEVAEIDELHLLSFDEYTGREELSGHCIACSKENFWLDAKLFALDYLVCEGCGHKYHIPSSSHYRKAVKLLDKCSSSLYNGNRILHKQIYPIGDSIHTTEQRPHHLQ